MEKMLATLQVSARFLRSEFKQTSFFKIEEQRATGESFKYRV